ncbi:Cupredoxin [Moelleriella libera RCEF 2490]|uniref:Cupredoxin n=1 Tax=Moelleriella libera RCEF 2490 TaxID=1081109 RepID=A0A162IDN8_9HYPO|nr:Cupredoxin [Moelleriella libera RCEF 2490]
MGPLIEANWGDWIRVNVFNNITTPNEDGFTLHWHGLLQKGTSWYDGVPGVSQCPITPGTNFTYLFRADQVGSSWYHSHYTAQYTDGAFGPMVFYGPTQPGVKYHSDLGFFVFHDYTHKPFEIYRDDSFKRPPQFHDLDNNLLNGRGCDVSTGTCNWKATQLQTHRVKVGKSYRMRLVNAGGVGSQKISVDEHNLTVIAIDYVPVLPYSTKTITLGIGQRTDVIFQPVGEKTKAVYVRGVVDLPCTNGSARNDEARAIILFDSAHPNTMPTSTASPWDSNGCKNDPLAMSVPAYAQRPLAQPATTQELYIDAVFNSTGSYVFSVNNRTFHSNYNYPIILAASENNVSYLGEPDRVTYNFGSNSSVRVIIYNLAPFAHPMHLHGHNFWALADGFGKWNGKVVNRNNPARRDTILMPPGSPNRPAFLVLEWMQDNPGIWPMHCHIALHNSHGLFINIAERLHNVPKPRQFPRAVLDACKNWQTWTKSHVVDEVDSGI